MRGSCSRCGGQIIEARGRRTGNDAFLTDPQGPMIKTKCGSCGRFFGYRYVESESETRSKKRREARGSADGGPDGELSGLWETAFDEAIGNDL